MIVKFMQDRSKNLTQIDLEITHSCNKGCKLCDHRIHTSDYEMSLGDYMYIVANVGFTSKFKSVFIIGGEPTCHTHFEELINRVKQDFKGCEITIQTNGRLLPKFYHIKDVQWVISEYPGWNDEVIKEYEGGSNVRVYRFGGGFWDTYEDPNLSDEDAKQVRDKCLFTMRVLGRKLYDCCLSEGIERDLNTPPVHVPFTYNWREDIKAIQTYHACKHCFRAAAILKTGKMYDKRTKRHDGKKADNNIHRSMKCYQHLQPWERLLMDYFIGKGGVDELHIALRDAYFNKEITLNSAMEFAVSPSILRELIQEEQKT